MRVFVKALASDRVVAEELSILRVTVEDYIPRLTYELPPIRRYSGQDVSSSVIGRFQLSFKRHTGLDDLLTTIGKLRRVSFKYRL